MNIRYFVFALFIIFFIGCAINEANKTDRDSLSPEIRELNAYRIEASLRCSGNSYRSALGRGTTGKLAGTADISEKLLKKGYGTGSLEIGFTLQEKSELAVLLGNLTNEQVENFLQSYQSCMKDEMDAYYQVRALPKLKKPTFSEQIENVSFSLGERGISIDYTKKALKEQKEPYNFGEYKPVKLYMKNGNLFADVKIFGGSGLPPIEIKQNELINKPHDWDFNSNDKALEIVDKNKTPIYQFYYKTPSHIVVNGIFPFPGGLILANENGVLLNPSLPTTFTLKRIFKYPSWKYPGEYEE